MDDAAVNRPNRLTKQHQPAGFDMPSSSLGGQSSENLHRQPSKTTYPFLSKASRDHQRKQSTSNPHSSESSVERPSPQQASTEFSAQGQSSTHHTPASYFPRQVLPENSTSQLIGAPFDGAGVLQTLDSTKGTGYQNSLRRPGPPALSHTAPDLRMLTPSLRQSASFSSGDRTIVPTQSPTDAGLATTKRYSDEANGGKIRWRKKSGISGFMNSVLGSPRSVKISAPENPVHMIHVGYDNETGQFTVCFKSEAVKPLMRRTLTTDSTHVLRDGSL